MVRPAPLPLAAPCPGRISRPHLPLPHPLIPVFDKLPTRPLPLAMLWTDVLWPRREAILPLLVTCGHAPKLHIKAHYVV